MADTEQLPIDIRGPRTNTLPGNAWWAPVFLSTADQDMHFWHMKEGVDSHIYGVIEVPFSIGATPAAKIILDICSANTTASKDFRIQASINTTAETESYDVAKTAITLQTVTSPTTAYERKLATFTVPTSGAFPVVAKDYLDFDIYRNGAHASDNVLADLLIKGAWMEIDRS